MTIVDSPSFLDHDGCRLVFAVRGAGEPVLWIQGVGVHGDGWMPQVEALAERYRCLWFDNRGVAQSQPVAGKLSVERMAGDALALLNAAGMDRAHIVAHSLGGLVALHLALQARARVRSLSLLCTFANGRAVGASARMIWLGTRTRLGTRRMRRAAFLEMVIPPESLASADRDALAAKLAPVFGHDLADHPGVEMEQLAAMRTYDVTPRLAELAGMPTLVVSAAHDPVAPPALGRAIATGIPGSRYVELDGGSHGVPIQAPERINALLLDHLDRN